MAANRFGDTPLIAAIRNNDIDQVASVLDAGANIEEPDIHGYPGLPLRTACFAGNVPVIRLLLKRGANINAVTADGAGAPVRLALRGGHDEVAALLLACHADLPPDLKVSPALLARAQEISSTLGEEITQILKASPGSVQAPDTQKSSDYWEKYTPEKNLSNSFKRHSNAWEQVSTVDNSKPDVSLIDFKP